MQIKNINIYMACYDQTKHKSKKAMNNISLVKMIKLDEDHTFTQ